MPEGDLEALLAALRGLDAVNALDADAAAERVLAHTSNNLDPVACRLLPVEAEVKAWLAAQTDTASVLVTGSGSCVFAAVKTRGRAEAIAADARARGWWSCATEFTGVTDAEIC